jgi:ribosomal protein S18 acetylase RimI-like enzyme
VNLRAAVVDASATRELRRALLRPQWAPGTLLPGDGDPAAVHLAVYDAGELVGCCVLQPRPYPPRPDGPQAWQLRGMAVAVHRQRQGVGGAVLDAAVAELQRRGARIVWCDARTTAAGFYRRHGFTGDGPEFEHAETGLPHRRMWRELPD